MRHTHQLLTAAALSLAVFTAAHAAAPLRSPWDLQPVAVTDASYSCPALTVLPKDIVASDFYSDAKHSVIDPKRQAAYQETQKPFHELTNEIEKAADRFQANGSRAAAACVLQLLDAEAAGDAMTGSMSSNQAYYVQNWTLGGVAVSWLKVRSAEPGTPEQRKAAIAWLTSVAMQTRTYFAARNQKGTSDGTNNHYYWAGFAVMASGISANDRILYDFGVLTYMEAMKRVTPDGTLPLEMDRGQRALHYHLFAIAPLVMIAEFGAANGQDLYAANNAAMHRLISRTVAGLIDNSFFTQKAGVPQDTPAKSGIKSDEVIALVPYARRFPDPNLNKLIGSTDLHPYGYLGGMPPK
jgi:poly(beta-D-mannuronate) lyase